MEHLQLGRVLMVALIILVAAPPSLNQPPPDCNSTCGKIPIPYPFGTGYSSSPDKKPCFLEPKFNVSCNYSQSQIIWGVNIPVINITVQTHQMDVPALVSWFCDSENYNTPTLTTSSFSISRKENKFVTVGCDSYGYLNSVINGNSYSTGCLTRCYGNEFIDDGTCSGIGCCQMDIPHRMRNMSIKAYNFPNSTEYNNCSYSFVVKEDSYNFSASHLRDFPYERLPLVLDWTVGNTSCSVAKSKAEYACRQSSHCDDKDSDYGYRCICDDGYEGNPYIGCTDVDECKTNKHTCISESHCHNIDGSYECLCPHGEIGNGKRGGGCIQRVSTATQLAIGVSSSLGSIILLLGLWQLYKVVRQKKIRKRKEEFFKQNGGLLLKQRLSSGEVNVDKVKLFSLRDLEKATDHFNVNRILGKGGQGTVYKGMLTDGKIVAVKKFKVEGNVEEFINEFLILSQINHRNVVKLLGSCLETEIPLLVYEFISNGNLFEYLHEQNEELLMTWDMRLRIATEIAAALFYLHSAACQPIYHRDIKSTNILLDEKYRAKVADFGTSRMVSIEATFGYLDPEFFQTSQFTEKSDVYSFGVVLVELLTGQKPISSLRSQEAKSLASYFILCMEENRLFDIVDERVMREGKKEHIIAVANLASRCLELNGKKRPTMKEITTELEGIQKFERKSDIQDYQSWAVSSMTLNTEPPLNKKAPTLEDMPIMWTT